MKLATFKPGEPLKKELMAAATQQIGSLARPIRFASLMHCRKPVVAE
jgi:hypothetical protein